jgi:hypothetical protein
LAVSARHLGALAQLCCDGGGKKKKRPVSDLRTICMNKRINEYQKWCQVRKSQETGRSGSFTGR